MNIGTDGDALRRRVHPEWKASSNRLLRLRDGVDRTSPRHWTGKLTASSVDLGRALNIGKMKAVTLLAKCSWFNKQRQVEYMLHPLGK